MHIRRGPDTAFTAVDAEFGRRDDTTFSVEGQSCTIPALSSQRFSTSEPGFAHVYEQVVEVTNQLETLGFECRSCASCLYLRLSGMSWDSGRTGYCTLDLRDELVEVQHHCDSWRACEAWRDPRAAGDPRREFRRLREAGSGPPS